VGDTGSGGPTGQQAAVEVRLLGGFGLRVDGQPVPAGSWRLRKARDIVKILALAPGHRWHRDEVIEALWPERDTSSGLNNLHQALHIARRGLAGAGQDGSGRARLRVRDEWVTLCPDEELRVDVEEFEAAAAAAAGSADPEPMEAALLLYRGDLLPEDRYEEWALARRDELRGQRRALITGLAALREAAGDSRAAVGLLSPLVADDPADELAQRALIRAYALTGDRGAALRQYQALAATLRDTLAVPPDALTEQLYRDVLSGAVGGRPPAGTAGPRRRQDTPSPERTRQPGRQPRQARLTRRAGHNLPVLLSTFVGRDQALADLGELLGERRMITLTGPGGCGKTRLAVELAQRALPRFADGAWLADLAAVSGTGDDAVGRALAGDLGLREQSGQSPLEAVAAGLAGKAALLVMDNCEHQAEAAARAAAELLRACPGLVVLATSREPLRVPGEVLWQVPPLAEPDPRHLPGLTELRRYDSVALFTERAMAAQPGFRLDVATAPAVAEICARLDGLPLAIELAAARVPALGPAGVAEGLDDRFGLLTGGSRTALGRQRTLAATFDWSYELLSDPERAAFRRLSVFADSFSLPAAGAVAAGPGVDRENIAALLADLVGRSMVSIEQEPAASRYRLIESLREYGRARLAEAGEASGTGQRHAAWYLTLAREAAGHFGDPGRRLWFERIDADQADFQAALGTLLDADPDRALAMAAALWPYWVLRGSFGEGLDRLQAALAASGGRSPARVEALLGSFAIRMHWTGAGEDDPAPGEALALATALGDPPGMARTVFFAGVQAWVRGEPGAARRAFLRCAAIARRAGLTLTQACAAHALACVAWSQGKGGQARQRLRAALALALRAVTSDDGAVAGEQAVGGTGEFWQLGIAPVGTSWWLGAPRLVFEEPAAALQAAAGLSAVACVRASMGSLARAAGDHDEAAGLLDEALGLFEQAGDDDGAALVFARQGNLAIAVGRPRQAAEFLTRSLEIRRDLGDQCGIGLAQLSLGRVEIGSGRLERAGELFTEAAASFRAGGDRPALIQALIRLGELQVARLSTGEDQAGGGLRLTGAVGHAGRGGRGGDRPRGGAAAAGVSGDAVRLLESAVTMLRAMGHGVQLGLGLAALAEACQGAGQQARAAAAAREATALLARAPGGPGRRHALDRLAAIARAGQPERAESTRAGQG
jgi:predicted ATPase/DNA-binding SARP family transcriptional activator